MKNRSLILFLLTPLLMFASPIWSQSTSSDAEGETACPEHENWDVCLARVLDEMRPEFQEKIARAKEVNEREGDTIERDATKEANESMAKEKLSTDATENGVLRDLLPQVFTALGIDGLDDSNGSLKYSYNFDATSFGQFSLVAEAKQPELFTRLEMAIPEATRSDLSSKLSEELGDFDDTEVTLTLSAFKSEGKIWWGRRFVKPDGDSTVLTELADRLYSSARNRVSSAETAASRQFEIVGEQIQSLRGRWQEIQQRSAEPLPDWEESKITDTDGQTRSELQAEIKRLGELYRAEIESMDEALDNGHFLRFADLAAQQPQLLITAKRQIRDELAGAEGWSIGVRGEGSWTNLNDFRDECLVDASAKVSDYEVVSGYSDVLACFGNYVETHEDEMKAGWRWSLEADYSRTDAYDFARPDLGIDLQIDEVQSWIAKAAIGRSIRLDDKGLEISRFDLEATYDDVTGDPEKQSRFLLTGTLTQRLSDDMSLETSIVYADKPEYRGEVDEEFSARAGFKYKIDRKSGDG